MRLVVDASVVVQVLLSGSRLGPLTGHDLIAPPLLRSEVLSSLSELAYRGAIPADAGRTAARALATFPVRLDRPDELDMLAWGIAESHGWATTYDAEYIALARLLDVPLITIDERLRRGARDLVAMPAPAEL